MTAFARTAARALSTPIAGAAPIAATAATGAAEAAVAVEMDTSAESSAETNPVVKYHRDKSQGDITNGSTALVASPTRNPTPAPCSPAPQRRSSTDAKSMLSFFQIILECLMCTIM